MAKTTASPEGHSTTHAAAKKAPEAPRHDFSTETGNDPLGRAAGSLAVANGNGFAGGRLGGGPGAAGSTMAHRPSSLASPVIGMHTAPRGVAASLLADRRIQTKLTVNTPGDRFEQEADRIADRVVSSTGAAGPITPVVPGGGNGPDNAQRKCAECEEEESTGENTVVQRKASASGAAGDDTGAAGGPPNGLDSRSQGHPLAGELRSFYEPRIGANLGSVRLHHDEHAARMAGDINARAFTLGRDVYFGRNEFAPNTTAGKHLLAHELVHTVQQGATPAAVQRQAYQDCATTPRKSAASGTYKMAITDKDIADSYHCLISAIMCVFGIDRETAINVQAERQYSWRLPYTGPEPGKTEMPFTYSKNPSMEQTVHRLRNLPGPQKAAAKKFALQPKSVRRVVNRCFKQASDAGTINYEDAERIAEKLKKLPEAVRDILWGLPPGVMFDPAAFEKVLDQLLPATPDEQEKLLKGLGAPGKQEQGNGQEEGSGKGHDDFQSKETFAPGFGIVENDKGAEFRRERTKATSEILPLNTRMVVAAEENGWYFVRLNDGRLGYFEKSRVNTHLPEPKAQLYRIQDGDTGDKIVRKFYNDLNTWGADQRLYRSALLYVNEEADRNGIVAHDNEGVRVYAGKQIWIPSQEYAIFLRDSQRINSGSLTYDVTQLMMDVTLGPTILQAGIVHGALENIWDALKGLGQLIGMLWDLFVTYVTEGILGIALKIWKALDGLKEIDFGELVDAGIKDVWAKWRDPNFFARWHYRGWLIGYIAMEVILTFFTDGAIEVLRDAARATKIGVWLEKIISKSELLQEIAKIRKGEEGAKAFAELMKAPEFAKAMKTLEKMRAWVMDILKFPRKLVDFLEVEALEKLQAFAQKYGEKYMEKLRRWASRGEEDLKELLHCHSPCDFTPDGLARSLDEGLDVVDPRVPKLRKDYGDSKLVDDVLEEVGGDPGKAKKLLAERHGLDDVTNSILGKRKFGPYDPINNRAVRANGDVISLSDDGRWIYQRGGNKIATEYRSARHADLSGSDVGTDSFFQSHHTIQDKVGETLFAKENVPDDALFNSTLRYNREEAPAVLLRDSLRESPHGTISSMQRTRKAAKGFDARTVQEEFNNMLLDMEAAGVPSSVQSQLVKEANEYFAKLYKNFKDEALRDKIFGGWAP